MRRFDTLIVGAGASGLMAAGRYKKRTIAILEANPKPAQKIKISGGGRCNITNALLSPEHYLGDAAFISEILQGFDQKALLAYLKARGLMPILRKGSQYFCPHSSDEMINVLLREIKGVPVFYNHKVLDISKKEEGGFVLETSKGTVGARQVVVASGGLSFPRIGASDIAYKIAEKFGHTIHPTRPALVGMTLQKEQFWMKELSGTSLPVRIGVGKHLLEGDLLFAHKGISGPAVLDASLYWEKGSIEVDFAPHISLDREFFATKKQLSTRLGLPKRFSKAFLQHIGLCDMPAQKLSHAQRKLLTRIKSYAFAPAGNFGYGKAEVTKGGIATDEIDPASMQSKHVPGLYFLGECLDVTGRLGGYNFQWAFATAQRLKL